MFTFELIVLLLINSLFLELLKQNISFQVDEAHV